MREGYEDSFKVKNKLGFIDGTLERPKEQGDEEFIECHVWDMVNSMFTLGYLTSSIRSCR